MSNILCWLWGRSRNPYNQRKLLNKLHYKYCPDYNLGDK